MTDILMCRSYGSSYKGRCKKLLPELSLKGYFYILCCLVLPDMEDVSMKEVTAYCCGISFCKSTFLILIIMLTLIFDNNVNSYFLLFGHADP